MTMSQVRDFVLRDAERLASAGMDGFIIENFGDAPFFPETVPPQTVAQMTALAMDVHRAFRLRLGINVLRNDGRAAMAIAAAVDAAFIRVNVFTGARLTDQGLIQGHPHEILRDRKSLDAAVAIFADVAVKHSVPLAERPLEDEIEDTIDRAGADGIIVSGRATGKATPIHLIKQAKRAAGQRPVWIGSGVVAESAAEMLGIADGLIVGTSIKEGGITTNPVDPERAAAFMQAAGRRKL